MIVIKHDSALLADHSGTAGLQSINQSEDSWVDEQLSSSAIAILKSGSASGSILSITFTGSLSLLPVR
jgi:hypothetical protein